ncbi:MAG: 50S ribosomal protein L10 [Methanobrevibacter sp.]|nr:50S ribosomal protein L10 [Methanobrevibacter sp.]MCL2157298.1 50S ribosomal protein L10 [Methanobrevibacter sp.]
MAHVAEWKKEEVKELKGMIDSHEVVGIVNLLNIPAKQLQKMRQSLKDKATIRMSKKNLINLAFENCKDNKENISDLSNHMDGQPAIVFTDMNPFKLFKILESSKTSAPAKPGNIAPEDIIVPAGDTGFEPGPLLGELQQVGIPAKIDKGKIVVSKEHVLVKAGEEVSKNAASMLTRLDIHPMEVGIDLTAVYEDKAVFTSDLLIIDEEKTLLDLQSAYTQAFNLSVNASIPTKGTIVAIIQNAKSKSFNLAMNASILNSETAEPLISQANAKMLALASVIQDVEGALDDELIEKLSNAPVTTETVVIEENEDKEEDENEESEEKDEEASEEEAAAGLGALFG